MCVCVCACSVISVMSNFCNLMDGSPPGSSVHGILQASILGLVSMPSSRYPPNPGMEPTVPTSPVLAGGLFTTGASWEGLRSICVAENGIISFFMT